jgi:hypothetical protein
VEEQYGSRAKVSFSFKPEWWDAPLVQEEKYQGKGNL